MSGAGLIGELVELLRGQVGIYTELLSLSAEKRTVIVKNDIETLRKITARENELVGRSQRLEKSRVALIGDIASVLNERKQNITLSFLSEKLQGQPEAEEITLAASELRDVLNKLKQLNDQNKVLIQNSLDYIDFSINVIRSTAGDEPTFSSPYGENIPLNRGFFDARQ